MGKERKRSGGTRRAIVRLTMKMRSGERLLYDVSLGRVFWGNGRTVSPGVVAAAIEDGVIRPAGDGLLPGFSQSYALSENEKTPAH